MKLIIIFLIFMVITNINLQRTGKESIDTYFEINNNIFNNEFESQAITNIEESENQTVADIKETESQIVLNIEETENQINSNGEEETKIKSVLDFLLTAKEPLGNTMYIWGGGWNEEDTGAGVEARSIGVSPKWKKFYELQDKNYDYRNHKYKIHDGLDCSGYVGWTVYNTFHTKDMENGYVESSSDMAESFSKKGWGTFTKAENVSEWKAGDIMSMKGHVWISLGMCEDGSAVILHSSPPGVILCGTLLENGEKSQAIELAEKYMSIYYPKWYEKYPNCERNEDYLKKSSRMRWNRETLADDEGLQEMNAEEVLEIIFK